MAGIRYRPPSGTPATALITTAGYARLKAELDHLWRIERPEVVRALAAAAAEGDRSENAEYTYRKKQLGGIDRRIRYLQKRIPDLRVVDQAPSDANAVFFGATVSLEDTQGRSFCYRIVGPDETDAAKAWISIDAPVARALLKRRVDDEFQVQTPDGMRELTIVAITYGDDQRSAASTA